MSLSKSMLDLLIEHIDGPIPFPPVANTMVGRQEAAARRKYIAAGISAGLLRRDHNSKTAMTEDGRERLCRELAVMVEVLIRAKYLPDFKPAPDQAVPSVSLDSDHFNGPGPDKGLIAP